MYQKMIQRETAYTKEEKEKLMKLVAKLEEAQKDAGFMKATRLMIKQTT